MRKYLELLQAVMGTIAGLGFISALMLVLTSFAYLLPRAFGNFELPLAEPNQIAVADNGLIYCGSKIYNKIQIYNKEGKFQKGWFIKSGDRGFGITVNQEGLKVVTFANKHYFYDLTGNLLREEDHGDPAKSPAYGLDLAGLKGTGKGPVYDQEGNSYFIKGHWLFPKIIEKTRSGKEIIFVSSPMYLVLLTPVPALLLLLISSFAYGLIDWRLKYTK